MNALCEKYGDKIAVLGFICNQFGHQSNGNSEEFVKTLENVRPGNGFKCAPQLELFKRIDVNGIDQHQMFKWLKTRQKVPYGAPGDSKNINCDDNDSITRDDKFVLWRPIARHDIAWNFEKFLLGPDGKFIRRYNRYFLIGDIDPEINRLMGKGALS